MFSRGRSLPLCRQLGIARDRLNGKEGHLTRPIQLLLSPYATVGESWDQRASLEGTYLDNDLLCRFALPLSAPAREPQRAPAGSYGRSIGDSCWPEPQPAFLWRQRAS